MATRPVLAAHYLRPVVLDAGGHPRRLPPAVLATWDPAADAWDDYAWGIAADLAERVRMRVGDLEAELDRRAAALTEHAGGEAGRLGSQPPRSSARRPPDMPDPASPVRALPIGEPILRPLSPEGLARLHAASLRILAETGVAVGSAEIRDRLAAAGARVDGDRVRLPAALDRSGARAPLRGRTRWPLGIPPGIFISTAPTDTCPSTAAPPRSSTSTPASGAPPRRRTWCR